MNVHKGVLSLDIHSEVQINMNFGSLDTIIIHGKVKLTQVCPKQTNL